jgi:hypothetical protein
MTQGPNNPTEKDGDDKNRHQRQQSREVIETILLDPFSTRAVTSAKVDPLVQKPNLVRLISFKDQQELSKKLNGFMMARMRSKEKEVGAGSSRRLARSSGGRDLTEQEAIEKCDDIKHCIVDLDVAHDRWPAFRGSSIFSLSSNSSTSWSVSLTDLDTSHLSVPNGRPISVIPEPYEEAIEQNVVELVDCTKKSVQEEATPNPRRISRNDVLRTRRWGRRICIPSHLLRPPLIRRQSSTQHY